MDGWTATVTLIDDQDVVNAMQERWRADHDAQHRVENRAFVAGQQPRDVGHRYISPNFCRPVLGGEVADDAASGRPHPEAAPSTSFSMLSGSRRLRVSLSAASEGASLTSRSAVGG